MILENEIPEGIITEGDILKKVSLLTIKNLGILLPRVYHVIASNNRQGLCSHRYYCCSGHDEEQNKTAPRSRGRWLCRAGI